MPHKRKLPRQTSSTPKGGVYRGGPGVVGGMGKNPHFIEMWPDVENQEKDCPYCTKGFHDGEFAIKFRSTACLTHLPITKEDTR